MTDMMHLSYTDSNMISSADEILAILLLVGDLSPSLPLSYPIPIPHQRFQVHYPSGHVVERRTSAS